MPLAVIALTALSLVAGVGEAPAAKGETVTVSMLALNVEQPAFDVLIPNFERVYPNVKVVPTYAPSSTAIYQLETTEIAAGNAPDLLYTIPGCGSPVSVCALAKAGDLAPMIGKPWAKAKRSLPVVTSSDKHLKDLYSFTATVSFWGVWANQDLFKKLGLKVPQTFGQLLAVCQKAKAARTVALMLAGGNQQAVSNLIAALAVATVYGNDKQWGAKLKAGTVSFAGTAGWHQALQEVTAMNTAGCFERGVSATSTPSAAAQFAQGQALMYTALSQTKGTIDMGAPQFTYSFHPFPDGTGPVQTESAFTPVATIGVNSHSSAGAQHAAQTFVDFIARPKQDSLFAQTAGGLTQYQFLHQQIPDYMSDFSSVFKQHRYLITPTQTWWNASVLNALQENEIGLLTGQRSIDDILNAMDAAWKQGPD
jgi:raffinose/stachyose/melibiose transport system substrate-binding protein